MPCMEQAIEGTRVSQTDVVSAIMELNWKDRQVLGEGVWWMYNLQWKITKQCGYYQQVGEMRCRSGNAFLSKWSLNSNLKDEYYWAMVPRWTWDLKCPRVRCWEARHKLLCTIVPKSLSQNPHFREFSPQNEFSFSPSVSIAPKLSCQKNVPLPICFWENILLFIFWKSFVIYFWLCWVFVAAPGLSLAVTSRGYSSLRWAGFSHWWLLSLQSTGSRLTCFCSCGRRAQ